MMQDRDIMYYYETIHHVCARLSFLADDMTAGRIQATDAASLLEEENERLANVCESLKIALVGSDD